MSDIAQESASTLMRLFAEAASAVLSQIIGADLHAQPHDLENATEAASLLRIEISGALDGLCEIALSEAMTAQFAALLTGEASEAAAELITDQREAAAELIQQICGNAADRLRRAFGPLDLKTRLADERESGSGMRRRLLVNREGDSLEFELHILRLVPEVKPDIAPPISPSCNRNLDLLLDIELGVSLRFGTRQMLLKDIIELCSGSVVELDRHVQEPVDLLIDGRLIAQGEVVIVEGNYGLRITQVANHGEKIACLP